MTMRRRGHRAPRSALPHPSLRLRHLRLRPIFCAPLLAEGKSLVRRELRPIRVTPGALLRAGSPENGLQRSRRVLRAIATRTPHRATTFSTRYSSKAPNRARTQSICLPPSKQLFTIMATDTASRATLSSEDLSNSIFKPLICF